MNQEVIGTTSTVLKREVITIKLVTLISEIKSSYGGWLIWIMSWSSLYPHHCAVYSWHVAELNLWSSTYSKTPLIRPLFSPRKSGRVSEVVLNSAVPTTVLRYLCLEICITQWGVCMLTYYTNIYEIRNKKFILGKFYLNNLGTFGPGDLDL